MSSIQDRLNAMKQGTKTASAQNTGGTARRIEQGSIEERLAKAREDSKNINGWGGTTATPAAEKFQRETSRWTSDGGGRKSTARRMEDIQADLDAANNRRKQLQMEESILLAPDAMAPNDDRLGEVRTALEALAKEITALDTEKRVEELYSTPGHRDSFSGQFDANMELGRLSQDQGRAWSAYLDDPSDINRKQAELQDEAIRAFLLRNGAALDDEGVVGSWLSKDLASNLPQQMDQLKAKAGGAVVGGIAGALAGPAGIKKGIKVGSTLASGQQMFEVTRGAAYKRFIDMGVDDELARALAQDEGIVNGIIESGDTGLDWLMMGGSKALNAILPGLAGKATTALGKTALAQLWNKIPGAVKAVGGYALNIGQEGGEEGWQEGVSIANDKRALAGEDSGLWELAKASVQEALAEENRDQVLDAAKSGMKIAAMMGGAQVLGNQALAYGLGRGVSPADIEAIPSPESKSDENNLPAGQNLPAELAQAARETTSEGNSMGQAENAAEGLKMASEGIGAEQALPSPAEQSAYNAGKAGVRRSDVELVTEAQEQAFEAGQRDRIMSASDADLAVENRRDEAYTGINKMEGTNYGTEEVHLRDGSQRIGSANPGGEVSAVEGSTGRDQSWQAQSAAADRGAASLTYGKAVSTSSLGIAGGSQVENIRIATGGDTEFTRKAKAVAKQRGLRLVLFTGSNLEIRQKDGSVASVRAYISGDRVFVRADHPVFTSDQLMRHEAGHDMIAKGEVDLNAVRDRIEAMHGKEKVGQLAQMYVDAYEGTGLTPDEIWEEAVCDSLGDMNIFAKTASEQAAHEMLTETKKAATETETKKTRGPPSEGKASRDLELRGEKKNRPQSAAEWSAFNRSFSNKTRNIKPGTERRIIIITGNSVYSVTADGYMQGFVEEKADISQLQKARRLARKELINEIDAGGETFDNWSETVRSDRGGARGDLSAAANRKAADDDGRLSSGTSNRDRTGHFERNESDSESDSLIGEEEPIPGAIEYDGQDSYRVDESGAKQKFSQEVSLEERKANDKKALEHFGRTYKWAETGYLLLGGERLDFSGKHDGAPGGYRTVDHREIRDALGDDYGGDSYTGGMIQFMREGNIRIMPESNGINLAVAPTKAQEQALDDFISKVRGEVILDIDDNNGNTVVSVEYPRGTRASKVLNDIRKYFEDGTEPQVSQVSQFRYSRELDMDYMAAVERGDTKTARRMVEFMADISGYTVDAYHGTAADFTVFDVGRSHEIGAHFGTEAQARDRTQTALENDRERLDYWNHKAAELMTPGRMEELYGYTPEEVAKKIEKHYAELETLNQNPHERMIRARLKVNRPLILERDINDWRGWTFAEMFLAKLNEEDEYHYDWADDSRVIDLEELNIDLDESDRSRLSAISNAKDVDVASELMRLFLESKGIDGVKYLNEYEGSKEDYSYIALRPSQVKLADAVTRDDDGNVIPLSKRFDSDNDDIRYSRELDSVNALREQNEALQEKVDYWKGQTKRTTQPTLRKGDVEKLAKNIIKKYDGVLDASEISGELKDLGDFILRGGDPDTDLWTGIKDRSMNIARQIVNSAQVLTNEEVLQDYKKIKTYLRNHPLAFNDKSDIADFNDFRKRNMGRFIISKDGTPVDSEWAKLQELFGESYFPSTIDHPAEQLQHIADLFDNMEPIFENPYSFRMAEATEYVANDIVDSLFSDELRLTPPTFADRQAEKLDKQKAKDKERLERLRQQKNDRIAEIRKEGQKRTREAVKAIRADRDAKIAEMKKNFQEKASKDRENRKAKELRERIQRHANDLSQKLINGSDKKHIPQELQGTVAKLLECINLESNYTYDPQTRTYKKDDAGLPTRRTKAFAALKREYEKLANELTIDPDLMGEDGLLSDVIDLADKRLVDMNSTELETVWMAVRSIEMTVLNANRAFSDARWETISDAAEALRQDNIGKALKTEYNGGLGKAQQLTGLDMMTPEAYLHRLGNTGDAMFRIMRDAQDEHIRMMKAVSDFTHENLKDVDVNKLEKTMHTVTLGGEDVKLSTAQLMELHVLMRRQQAQEHIMLGGILPDVVSNKGIKKISRAEPVRGVTLEEINKALSLLSADEVAIAEKLQEFASTTLSDYGNQASMKVYNYEKFNEKNYWPIRSNRQEIRSDVQKDTAVTSVANRGFTKGTKPHANTSVRLGSIFDTFSTHSSEMATYAAWLGASEDINRIRNYTFRNEQGERTGTVKGIIERVHGSRGTDYLQKLLADIANGIKGTHGETQFMSSLVGNYKAASVGANLRVVIQQPTAILRALDMLDPQYLVAGLKPAGGWKKAMKYAPIAQWKDWGYFDINTGRQMKDVLFDSDSAVNKVKNAGMWGAGKMDSLSWGLLWNAVETEVKAKQKNLKPGTKDFYDAVAKRFTEIVDHTQVVDGILQRSQIMRSSDGLTKMATSFMGEPTKQYNMLLSAAYDAKHSPKAGRKAAKARLARAAVTLAISGVANAMMQSLMDAVRDDDKEKEYWEKWRNHLFGFTGEEEGVKDHVDAFFAGNLGNTVNPAAYIPYVKDILSILQGYDVSRMDMESVEKTITASQNMIKALNGDGKYTIGGASANLFAEVARLVGIPVANLKREIKSFAMLYAIESDNYLMQYRMEKASLDLNYSSNSTTFLDILYNAYTNDQAAYKLIYADMVKGGYDEEKIQNGMESRMKKAQGVKKAEELEQRYLSPSLQTSYDKTMKSVQSSSVWRGATAAQRDHLEDNLYDLVTGNSDGKKMQEKIDEGKPHGISETEYLLYKLALEMADKPSKSGKYGSYTNDEVEAAIESLNLSDKESSYLWLAQGKNEKSNPWG